MLEALSNEELLAISAEARAVAVLPVGTADRNANEVLEAVWRELSLRWSKKNGPSNNSSAG